MSVLDPVMASVSPREPQSMRWSVDEFFALSAGGHFEGRRVLLFDGEIIQMPPMGHEHKSSLVRVTRWLGETFDKASFSVQIQMPLIVGNRSDLEPDGAVVSGSIDEQKSNARTALFIIEVSDSSLSLDRKKAPKYAAAGVGEYWIINIPDRQIEAYRLESGARPQYGTPVIVRENGFVAPVIKPTATICVHDLLPVA